MLGSLSEAEDAVQEAWIRLSRSDANGIGNLGGWLTTVVARVCLDMLRSRKSRREEPIGPHVPEPAAGPDVTIQEAEMADRSGWRCWWCCRRWRRPSGSPSCCTTCSTCPFDDIAPIVGRTATATRQLASRARRRVQGADRPPEPAIAGHKKVVDAFLAASRNGDFEGLLALLDPDVVLRADPTAALMGDRAEIRGAQAVAKAYQGRAQTARTALIDGAVGVVVAPSGRLMLVLV